MLNLTNNYILVVGLGYRTGLSVSNFLVKKGFDVVVSDNKSENELSEVMGRLDPSVRVVTGKQDSSLLDENFDLIVLSPGVPRSIPLIKDAEKRGIPVISEIELSYHYLKGLIIAITGTDGKTTTTSLVGHILKSMKFQVFIGGNIGTPLISQADKTDDDSITVVELSSFQLETINNFRADVSSILNVTPDHMDRYEGMADYCGTKLRITMNQKEDDFYIYNYGDPYLINGLEEISAIKKSFSLTKMEADAWMEGDFIYLKDNGEKIKNVDINKLKIMGLHNIENTMAAVLMVVSILRKKGIRPDYKKIADSCYSFKGLSHRMEIVGEYEGRTFINDSKATTISAVEMAIKSITAGCVLIVGGKTKGDDYSRLIEIINGRVKSLILIGETKEYFLELFEKYDCVKADTMENAVTAAMNKSGNGDVILLSPACASFDMFKNYEERGDSFKESYGKLVKGELNWI